MEFAVEGTAIVIAIGDELQFARYSRVRNKETLLCDNLVTGVMSVGTLPSFQGIGNLSLFPPQNEQL